MCAYISNCHLIQVKQVTLEESVKLMQEREDKMKELQAKQAMERLARFAKMNTDGASSAMVQGKFNLQLSEYLVNLKVLYPVVDPSPDHLLTIQISLLTRG